VVLTTLRAIRRPCSEPRVENASQPSVALLRREKRLKRNDEKAEAGEAVGLPGKVAGLYNDPRVSALVNSPFLPTDQRMKLTRYLSSRASVESPIPQPFAPGPPSKEAEAGIAEIGLVVTGRGPEFPFRFREDHLLTNTQVDAATGGGKTVILAHLGLQAHAAGTAAWFFDTEGDLGNYVLANALDVQVLSYRDLRLALFDGPQVEGLQWREYLGKLVSTFDETLFAKQGMQNMTREIALELRERQGHFNVFDFNEALLRRKYRLNSREGGYWESLRNRFEGSIIPFLGETYGSGSHDIRALLQQSIVWQLEGLAGDLLSFWVTVLLLWVQLASQVTPRPRLRNLMVFDEFTRVCSKERSRQATMSESFTLDFIRTCRKRQIGMMIATQTPHLLPDAVLSNTNTWIVLRPTDGYFLRCVSQALDLDRDQEQYLMELPDRNPRRAVVRCPGLPEPFLVEIPEL